VARGRLAAGLDGPRGYAAADDDGGDVDLLQAWVAVGVPGLVLVGAAFVGRSRVRALVGYAILIALLVFFVTVPAGGGLSAAVIGLLAVVFVATGRGTHLDDRYREHHQQRERYTTADEPR
jgi:hypothetical protein